MYNYERATEALTKVIGWENHHDLTEVAALNPMLNESESMTFYGEYHPALKLDYIKAMVPANVDLSDYLERMNKKNAVNLLNRVVTVKELGRYGRSLWDSAVMNNTQGWANNTIPNENRLVGLKIEGVNYEGLTVVVNRLAVQFKDPQNDLKIRIHHSHQIDPIAEVNVTTTKGVQWNWIDTNQKLNFQTEDFNGGYFTISYRQSELTGLAIKNTKFNWSKGPCNDCGVSREIIDNYKQSRKYVRITPFYIPSGQYDEIDNQFWGPDIEIEESSNNYGLNLHLSIGCDLTDFIVNNRRVFTRALGLSMAEMILNEFKFTDQINFLEKKLGNLVIRDLEGDKNTKQRNLEDRVVSEIKALNFNTSSISPLCLSCDKGNLPKIKFR